MNVHIYIHEIKNNCKSFPSPGKSFRLFIISAKQFMSPSSNHLPAWQYQGHLVYGYCNPSDHIWR